MLLSNSTRSSTAPACLVPCPGPASAAAPTEASRASPDYCSAALVAETNLRCLLPECRLRRVIFESRHDDNIFCSWAPFELLPFHYSNYKPVQSQPVRGQRYPFLPATSLLRHTYPVPRLWDLQSRVRASHRSRAIDAYAVSVVQSCRAIVGLGL